MTLPPNIESGCVATIKARLGRATVANTRTVWEVVYLKGIYSALGYRVLGEKYLILVVWIQLGTAKRKVSINV